MPQFIKIERFLTECPTHHGHQGADSEVLPDRVIAPAKQHQRRQLEEKLNPLPTKLNPTPFRPSGGQPSLRSGVGEENRS